MTKQQVLDAMINLFIKVNAVDPNLSRDEIAKVKMNGLKWFQIDLGLDDDFKKEVLFKMLETSITNLNNGVKATFEPDDYTIFNYPQTLDEVAETVAEFT